MGHLYEFVVEMFSDPSVGIFGGTERVLVVLPDMPDSVDKWEHECNVAELKETFASLYDGKCYTKQEYEAKLRDMEKREQTLERSVAIKDARRLQYIRDELERLGHPLAPCETIVEKIRNLVAIIKSQGQLINVEENVPNEDMGEKNSQKNGKRS